MADQRHVRIALEGTTAIQEWMRKNKGKKLDLSGADLSEANLSGANLALANLERAILRKAYLVCANLAKAQIAHADLVEANLSAANLHEADLRATDLGLVQAYGANLSNAQLSRANLVQAGLHGADLRGAVLLFANLTLANLSEADLTASDLMAANFSKVHLHKAKFSGAEMGSTTIAGCDLSQCIGLSSVRHFSPSSVSIDTIIESFRRAGNRLTHALETFFLNAGVPHEIIETLPRILAEVKYCSCFVCYGEPDLDFAKRLVKDLKAKGVSCWLYSLDATPGERVWGEITRKRREAEKMIVVCSGEALVRDGVLKEIEEQIDEDPNKMVPISLDDLWKAKGFIVKRGQREDLKTFLMDRTYADFREELKYEDSLRRLLSGLERSGT